MDPEQDFAPDPQPQQQQQDIPASDYLGTNDVQVVSQDQGVSPDQFFGPSAAPAPAPTGFAANKAEFAHPSNFFSDTLRGLVDPSYKAQSFVGGLAQNTVGSRGVIGTLEQPGRVASSFMFQPATDSLTESRNMLTQATLHALQQARTMPEGFKKNQLLQTVQDNMGVLNMTAEDLAQLSGSSETAKQAFGNTLNAEATLYGGGSAGVGTKIGANLAERAAAGGAGRVAQFAANTVPRMIESGALGAAGRLGTNLANSTNPSEGVAATAGVAAMIPFVGSLLSSLKQGTGKGLEHLGEKIQTSVIRPTSKDVEDGFSVQTLKKYDLGGSLNQTLEKTNSKMNELASQLKNLSQASGDTVNLNNVYQQTEKQLLSESTAKNFGQNARIKNILAELKSETNQVAPQGAVDLGTATDVKRAAGTMGSWVYGFADKDASATEAVYTKFYQNLKKAIEGTDVGPEVHAINQQLQELIPVHNAVIRRIPIAERQNAVSLTDVISLVETAAHPQVAPIALINKASKSGRVGDFLSTLGSKLQNVAPSATNIGKRIFGK
jgi:hypothetical protein